MKLSKEQVANLSKEEKRYYKQYGSLPAKSNTRESSIASKPETLEKPKGIVTVLCVRFGDKYGPEYVIKLRNMVSKNMTIPYEFVCLTDDPNPIEGVRIIYQPSAGYNKLWWHKVHMFDPSLPISGRILYMDLDVIVCGNLDKLLINSGNNFLGILDFNRHFHPSWKYLNSSVMSWIHGTQHFIWDKFKAGSNEAMKLHGDQDWIWQCAKDVIKFWPKEWILSYKWEVRSREDLVVQHGKRFFKTVSNIRPMNNCSIVVFHGDPKPEDVKDPFVLDTWK